MSFKTGTNNIGDTATLTDLYSQSFGSYQLSDYLTTNIYSTGTYSMGSVPTLTGTNPALQVQGDLVCAGDITHNGKKLSDVLSQIEERLAILHPNPKLEQDWAELRDLRTRYVELEKQILEKEKVWKILKNDSATL